MYGRRPEARDWVWKSSRRWPPSGWRVRCSLMPAAMLEIHGAALRVLWGLLEANPLRRCARRRRWAPSTIDYTHHDQCKISYLLAYANPERLSSTASLANWADRRTSLCLGSQIQQLSAALPFAALLYFSHCLKIGSARLFLFPAPPSAPPWSRSSGARAAVPPPSPDPRGEPRRVPGRLPAGPRSDAISSAKTRIPPYIAPAQ